MSKLINCKDCGKEVSKNAKTCPNCGAKVKKKNIFLGIVVGIVAMFIIVAIVSNGGNEQPTTGKPATDTSTPSKSSNVVTKENYDKIEKDMTKDQVESILGKATSISESETPGVGKMEMHHYQKGFDMKAIDVTYLNGKVYTKNWTDL